MARKKNSGKKTKKTTKDPKQTKKEDKLIMPKHLASEMAFYCALKVYHEHPRGLAFDSKDANGFVGLIKEELRKGGVETPEKPKKSHNDTSHYTKLAQLPRYFGFVRYVTAKERKGDAVITVHGEKMFSAMSAKPVDFTTIHELLFRSLMSLNFGSGTEGVGSISCYEPFAVFFRAAKQLDGITASEFGYLVQKLDSELLPFEEVIEDLRQKRLSGEEVANPDGTQASNIEDWTSVLLLVNLHFLETKDVKRAAQKETRAFLATGLDAKYGGQLSSMPLCSRGYMRHLFAKWLLLVEKQSAETVDAYPSSLAAMSKDFGIKNSSVFEGFFKTLTGHLPEIPVFEVKDKAEFERVFRKLILFLDMPADEAPGIFEWNRFDECYYYTKASSCWDHRRLFDACKAYQRFLEWWDSRKAKFQIFQASAEYGHEVDKNKSLQLIKYGAPGTGKSFDIEKEVQDDPDTIRTTFHPDSDYASFVGAYKPTMGNDGKIKYEFVEQAFLRAYVNAWKRHNKNKAQYLVIEEINRGNCAQIFGDLFQLLDRNDKGYSAYPIVPDRDLSRRVGEAMEDAGVIIDSEMLEAVFPGKDMAKRVFSGQWLLFPSNLFIWATMNTSDQSLFPMDSAFKRRWDWKYVPIRMPDKKEDGTDWEDWTIQIPANAKVGKPAANYAWNDFLEAINRKIGELTSSEDKKLGYFFVKGDSSGAIPLDAFVNKVVFYLWNDAFRAVGTEELGFEGEFEERKNGRTEKKKRMVQFEDFFDTDGNPDPERIRDFLDKLEVMPGKPKSGASAVGGAPASSGASAASASTGSAPAAPLGADGSADAADSAPAAPGNP